MSHASCLRRQPSRQSAGRPPLPRSPAALAVRGEAAACGEAGADRVDLNSREQRGSPSLESLLAQTSGGERYLHWDELRHRPAPQGQSHEQWWLAEKLSWRGTGTPLPLLSSDGSPFWFCQPPLLLRGLHEIDRKAGASVMAPEAVTTPSTRDRYLLSSRMEEAITSSQMEGAATTHDVAKAMIRSHRAPRDRSERMILNNFRTMQRMRDLKDHPLTPQLVLDLHRLVSEKTLDDPADAGRLRPPGIEVIVDDDIFGTVFQVPSAATELEARLEQPCRFANGEIPAVFIHPGVRAITLHFWLAYGHSLCDGNGRSARALFYWSMLKQGYWGFKQEGYWLFEFISISSVINQARARYELSFLLCETDDNDLTYFLLAQVTVIQQAIANLHANLERKANELAVLQRRLGGTDGLNHRQLPCCGTPCAMQGSTTRCSPTRTVMASATRRRAAICRSWQAAAC